MVLFPPDQIKIDETKIKELNSLMRSTFRLITFSRAHMADDLLNAYIDSTENLQELMSIKNAQMEAQTPEEAEEYLKDLRKTLTYIIGQIAQQVNFETAVQLFQVFRIISPDAHNNHPNKFRNLDVQIGRYLMSRAKKSPRFSE